MGQVRIERKTNQPMVWAFAVAGAVLATLVWGQASIAAPLTVTSGLKVHLDAGVGVTSSGGSVSQWSDQSGNSNHVYQATAANQPALFASVINGLPVVRFDGNLASGGVNADFMLSTNTLASMITNNAYTTFTVFKPTTVFRNTSPGYTNDVVFGDSHGYVALALRKPGTLPAASLYAYNFSSTDDQAIVATTTGQFYIATTRLASGVLSLDVLGGPSATVASGTTATTGVLGLSSGYVFNQTIFRGDIAELLIYNRALNATERADVQLYLNEKYGLVPEPASAGLLCAGGLFVMRRGCSKRRSF